MYQLKDQFRLMILLILVQKKSKYGLATPSSSLTHNNYNINLFCNKILSQNEMYDILNKVWTPEINSLFYY